MANYFTADTHFTTERVRVLNYRPFKNCKQMDKKIIKNWNKCVKNNDFVYHLGDFGNYNVIKHLKGKVVLILGNYELNDMKQENMTFLEFKNKLINMGFYDVIDEKGLEQVFPNIDENKIKLVHKPMDASPNCFNLFGHIHGHVRAKDFGLNVGIDCYDYRLVSEEIILHFKKAIEEKVFDENVYCQKRDLV